MCEQTITKKCTKCKLKKSFNEFGPSKLGKFGKQSFCKECLKQVYKDLRLSYKNNQNVELPKHKICGACKQQKEACEFSKDVYKKDHLSFICKECNGKKLKKYLARNKNKNTEKTTPTDKKKICPKCKITYTEKDFYKDRNSPSGYTWACKYCGLKERKDKMPASIIRERKRRQTIPAVRIKANIRRRMTLAIAKGDKSAKTMELLGCSVDDFLKHLEGLFLARNGVWQKQWMAFGSYNSSG